MRDLALFAAHATAAAAGLRGLGEVSLEGLYLDEVKVCPHRRPAVMGLGKIRNQIAGLQAGVGRLRNLLVQDIQNDRFIELVDILEIENLFADD